MFIASILAVIAWGALAFGAVYPWAYSPLLVACIVVGLAGLRRRRSSLRGNRAVLISLVVTLACAALQLIPFPVATVRALSPAADAFLREQSLSYAIGVSYHPLSINPGATALGVVMLAAFVVFLTGLLRGLSSSSLRRLATAIAVFGAILALIGITQKAMLGDHAWGGMKIYGFWKPTYLLTTPFGPFVNKNHFAGWMLMGLPLIIGLALGTVEEEAARRPGGWRNALLWLSSSAGGRFQLLMLSVVPMAISLLMTKSRSGLAGLIVAMVISSIVAARRLSSSVARRLIPATLGAMFVILFFFAGGDVAARIVAETDSVDLRKNIWTDSVRTMKEFPLVGTGLNTFGPAMIAYQTSEKDKHFQEAHNDYLQLAVEGGLLLGVPILVTLVMVGLAIRRRFSVQRDDPMTYWLRVGATTGLAAVGAQSLVEFSLQMPGNAAFFVVLLAIALHHRPPRSSSRKAESHA